MFEFPSIYTIKLRFGFFFFYVPSLFFTALNKYDIKNSSFFFLERVSGICYDMFDSFKIPFSLTIKLIQKSSNSYKFLA